MDFPCFGAKKKDGLGEVAGGGRDLIKARHGNKMLKSFLAPCVREPLNTFVAEVECRFPPSGRQIVQREKSQWGQVLKYLAENFCLSQLL